MFSKYVLTGIIAVALIAGIAYVIGADKKETPINPTATIPEEQTMEKKTMEETTMDNKTMEDKTTPPPAMADTAKTHGAYKEYSPEAVAAEHKAGNKVVLFFHAPWCPYCKAANEVFSTKTSGIPANVTVLKTDYDSNTELKKKYGVTYQHTFVQVDASGNMITKWNGGDIDNLKKYIK